MTNIFLSNDDMFDKASNLGAADLLEYFSGLSEMGVFANAVDADSAFDEAVKARRAEMVRKAQDGAIEEMRALWDGFTIPKSLQKKLIAIGDVAAEAEMPKALVYFAMSRDEETGEMVISSKVADNRIKSTTRGRASKGGKAMLDNKVLTAKLLRDEYADSFATKALENPHAADSARWGPKTRLNATQAVKADSVLCERLTFAN